jgi:hypothetical protein
MHFDSHRDLLRAAIAGKRQLRDFACASETDHLRGQSGAKASGQQ